MKSRLLLTECQSRSLTQSLTLQYVDQDRIFASISLCPFINQAPFVSSSFPLRTSRYTYVLIKLRVQWNLNDIIVYFLKPRPAVPSDLRSQTQIGE
jgi:hypothetical protein